MNRKKTIIVISLIGLVMVSWGIYNFVRLLPLTAKLNIIATPSDAKVLANNKAVKAGIIRVRPGQYKVTATRGGFASVSQTVSVIKGETKFVGLILLPNSSDTSSWYLSHPYDQQLLEQISGQNADTNGKKIADNLSLIKNLPFVDDRTGFRIDYGQSHNHPNDPTAVAIYITIYGDNPNAAKEGALSWIRFMGADPTKLEIIYSYSNPGTQPSSNPQTEE